MAIELNKAGKMKLLIASDSMLPRLDGISVFLMNVLPRLKDDFDISIVAPRFGGKDIGLSKDMVERYLPGITNAYTRLSFFKAGDFPLPLPSIWKIRDQVKNADIVFVQTIGPVGLMATWYAKRYNKKVVTFIHSIEFELWMKSIKSKFWRRLTRRMAKKAMSFAYGRSDYLMIPSEELRGILEGQKIKTRMAVVPVGVDTNRFIPPKDKWEAKRRIGITDKQVIGYVGRIAREKDLTTLITAFEDLERKREDIVLLIVGTGLEAKLKEEATSKNIKFIGQKEDVVPYLQAMDIFVLPSLTETSSLSTLEAMSCAVACVVTPVGILKDIIMKGDNGFLFPKGSTDTLASILEKLIKNEQLRSRVGRNGRVTIRQNFSWDRTAEKILGVLRRV